MLNGITDWSNPVVNYLIAREDRRAAEAEARANAAAAAGRETINPAAGAGTMPKWAPLAAVGVVAVLVVAAVVITRR
jgi:hypothetical protein